MSPVPVASKPYALATFFILAFGLSWAVWLPDALASHGLVAFRFNPVLTGLLGAVGPSLAALVTTAAYDGLAGLAGLLKRLLTWRVGLQWYLFVLLWPAGLSLAGTGLSVLLGGPLPNFLRPPFVEVFPQLSSAGLFVFLPAFFLQQLLFGSSIGEEIGWRGFALPRLQAQVGSLPASLLLGLVWGVWHLPLWLTRGTLVQGAASGWHFLGLLATTILFTWVFNHTRGSLLQALLFHAAIGVTGLFLASAQFHPALGAALSCGMAALAIGVSGPQLMPRRPMPLRVHHAPRPAAE
ncbi:MAG: CPBP family intramembrane metalloprotease [Anaerolineales bacterium]|nr:CPBP family intramembrane metalloprotease [Anaerolineales bacterium]